MLIDALNEYICFTWTSLHLFFVIDYAFPSCTLFQHCELLGAGTIPQFVGLPSLVWGLCSIHLVHKLSLQNGDGLSNSRSFQSNSLASGLFTKISISTTVLPLASVENDR